MRLPFLRKPTAGGEPLIVSMTGVRLGESVIFYGRTAAWAVPLAIRTGLSGTCLVVGRADVTAAIESVASRDGALVETAAAAPDERRFDLAVVEVIQGWEAAAGEVQRAVRPGGRLIAVSGAPKAGLLGKLGSASEAGAPADEVAARLSQIGWERVRAIGERDGVTFVEAFAAP